MMSAAARASLFASHIGEQRMSHLALGEATHVPLRLTVSHEVQRSHRVDPLHSVEEPGQDVSARIGRSTSPHTLGNRVGFPLVDTRSRPTAPHDGMRR